MYNNYKNTKLKLLRVKADILYNKICKIKQMTPKYFSIKINRNSRQNKNTRIAATKYRLNKEIKFLCCSKQKLNELLYKTHLECAYYWNIM